MEFIDKINQLPEPVKKFFFSNDIQIEIEKSCFLYGVDEEDAISHVSDTVAFIFAKDSGLSDLPASLSQKLQSENPIIYGLSYELNKRIFSPFPDVFRDSKNLLDQWEKLKSPPIVSEEEAMNKVIKVESWILEEEKEQINQKRKFREEEETQRQNVEEVAISDGLAKYPEVGEQIITSRHIRLKIFPEPVRPSIKNWLSDYTFGLGYESHDAMTRGDYLFKSENGRILSQEDREKLSLILKSYDEKIPLTTDVAAKQIIFPEIQMRKKRRPEVIATAEISNPKPAAMPEPAAPKPAEVTGTENEKGMLLETSNIKFSSPQVFANEKEIENPKVNQPIRIRPASRESSNGHSQKERSMPGNIINLKDQS